MGDEGLTRRSLIAGLAAVAVTATMPRVAAGLEVAPAPEAVTNSIDLRSVPGLRIVARAYCAALDEGMTSEQASDFAADVTRSKRIVFDPVHKTWYLDPDGGA